MSTPNINQFPKNIILILICLLIGLLLLRPSNCLAWTGYERSDGSEIEISSGNLVREGEEIKFYDWKSEEDRKAEVRSVEYLFNATKLEIYDYVEQKVRIFEML